jgi:leucyl-tRNA synthetase
VSDDFGRRQTFNTAIAAVMELLNEVQKSADQQSPLGLAVEREALEAAVLLLSPITPHVCHYLWQTFGHQQAIIDAPWPQVDKDALTVSEIVIVIQVNGKLRSQFTVSTDKAADKAYLQEHALADGKTQKFIDNRQVIKVIAVANKLVNIVIKP